MGRHANGWRWTRYCRARLDADRDGRHRSRSPSHRTRGRWRHWRWRGGRCCSARCTGGCASGGSPSRARPGVSWRGACASEPRAPGGDASPRRWRTRCWWACARATSRAASSTSTRPCATSPATRADELVGRCRRTGTGTRTTWTSTGATTAAISGQAALTGFESRIRHRDGHDVLTMVYTAPLIDGEGRHTGWMSSVVDITAQKLRKSASASRRNSCSPATRGQPGRDGHDAGPRIEPALDGDEHLRQARPRSSSSGQPGDAERQPGRHQAQAQRAARDHRAHARAVRRPETTGRAGGDDRGRQRDGAVEPELRSASAHRDALAHNCRRCPATACCWNRCCSTWCSTACRPRRPAGRRRWWKSKSRRWRRCVVPSPTAAPASPRRSRHSCSNRSTPPRPTGWGWA